MLGGVVAPSAMGAGLLALATTSVLVAVEGWSGVPQGTGGVASAAGGSAPARPAPRRLQQEEAAAANTTNVTLYGLPDCPCLVQDAPNGYLAAAPDGVPNT